MAILGHLIDKTTVSRAGNASWGTQYFSLAHSLPATNPELVLCVLRSAQEVGAAAGVSLLGLGGNASLATYGIYGASAASSPTLLFDVYSWVFYSTIR